MSARIVNISEAKAHLSKLVQATLNGEEIIIAKAGRPVAKMLPIKPQKRNFKFGTLKGNIIISDDFDAPLPKGILDAFEGKTKS